ncbi:MAG: acyltransferase [Bacteroidales bacterium]|nr:acyltransferase [Bacteroidales bacterium]
MKPEITDRIFNISDKESFRECALEIFRMQFAGNKVYSDFIKNLGINPSNVKRPEEIPFLPVEFFKTQKVITGTQPHIMIFESSGTTSGGSGRHYIIDIGIYEKCFLRSFNIFYGDPADYIIAALLPSYAERENSSLVYMMDKLIGMSSYPESGFYKDDFESLISAISVARRKKGRVLLMGVSFALLDLAERYSPDLHNVVVMETGGMKGRRKEITRTELHSVLKQAFNVDTIHSEYGSSMDGDPDQGPSGSVDTG